MMGNIKIEEVSIARQSYSDNNQREITENYISNIQPNFDKQIVTEIRESKTFYKAEDYHQDFYKKDPERYKREQETRQNKRQEKLISCLLLMR